MGSTSTDISIEESLLNRIANCQDVSLIEIAEPNGEAKIQEPSLSNIMLMADVLAEELSRETIDIKSIVKEDSEGSCSLEETKFNKTYSDYHDSSRRRAWEENMEKIRKHNDEAERGLHTFFIKDNHLSDMSTQSYLQKMVRLTKSVHRKVDPDIVGDIYDTLFHLPETHNWVDKGFITPAYNQKDCGSCYAFSIAGSIQGQIFKQTDKLVPLSEQQLVDCSVSFGNYGCAGGSLRNTMRYLEKTGGLMAYDDYPYVSKQQKCRYDKHRALVNITSWTVLPARDERALETAVARIGPVAASINASPHTFQLYHSGIYDDITCTSNHVNHAMLVVGYTKDAWILKNWWGQHWGENGYMRLRRHINRCGIANYAAYALV